MNTTPSATREDTTILGARLVWGEAQVAQDEHLDTCSADRWPSCTDQIAVCKEGQRLAEAERGAWRVYWELRKGTEAWV